MEEGCPGPVSAYIKNFSREIGARSQICEGEITCKKSFRIEKFFMAESKQDLHVEVFRRGKKRINVALLRVKGGRGSFEKHVRC
ncbi:MAG: hypothetical protein H3C68_00025 [Deltaproteobacteria bacterium]|nr:hypothetical protein [Deltaproteobacteria bacterium]MBZ0219707.1 hypothetical protein [Deltaproteobacteria bacterium]